MMTPQKAIEGCKKHDRISQKFIFDEFSEGMLMLCLRYVKSLPDAEERMQNGFYNFFKTIDRFAYSGNASIGGWLKKIMVNECLMFLRKKGNIVLIEEEHGADVQCSDAAIAMLNATDILQLVISLPTGYRTVFNLFVIEGYSHKEIALLLGISEGTSKSQLNKARALLQKQLKKNEAYYEGKSDR